jgi:two-component system, NarL family, sensor histidine kinase UhpB
MLPYASGDENRKFSRFFSGRVAARYAVTVSAQNAEDKSRKTSARRDFAVVAALSLLTALICVKFDVSEMLAAWTRQHERLQLDELPGILLVVAVCLIWFSSRRYREAKRQLALREAMEKKLAEAHAENQRLALKYVDMQEHERKALAHDLHDELGQYVNAIKLDAVSMRDAARSESAIQAAACAMIVNIDRVYDVLRGLIRALRPVGFDDLGVFAALEHCINEWRVRLPAMKIDLSNGAALESLDEVRGLVIFRLVQEALTNIARHSSASQVRILIEPASAAPGIDVLIADNGCGVDLGSPRTGLGLVGMRERVAALGGRITLASRPGEGFEVRAFLPLSAPP